MNMQPDFLKNKHLIIMGIALFIFSSGPVLSICQEKKEEEEIYRQPWQVPSVLRENYAALGNRLQKAGKERITIKGILKKSSGSKPIQVIIEKGGKARIDTSSKSVRFDGKNVSNGINSDDDELLESFVDDLPENLIETTASGAALRLIGHRYKDAQGKLCNIFDAWILSKSNPQRQRTFKRYCFDSNTMLLSWVQYRPDGETKGTLLETRFDDWVVISGQAIPATISRRKDGIIIFSLEAQELNVSSKAADDIFNP